MTVNVVQDSRARERWIDTVERGLIDRQTRVTERTASNYSPGTRAQLTDQLTPDAFTGNDTNCEEAKYSYLSVLARSRVTSCAGRANKSWTPTGILPAILDWNFFDAIEERRTPHAPSAVTDALTTIARGSDQRQQSWIAWWFGGVIVLWSFAGVRWARGKVLPRVFAEAPDLETVVREVNSAKKGGIVLLIGPPRTGKDEIVGAVIKKVTHAEPICRLRLIDVPLTDNYIRETRLTVERAIGAPPRATDDPTIWVHLSNLEAQLVDKASRAQILRLIAKLLDSPPTRPVALIITSSVDPVAHFTELFDDERRDIYTDHVPEIALSTAALLLSRSRRCFAPLGKRKSNDIRRMWERWRRYEPSEWRETLQDELSAFAPLKPIYCELTGLWHKRTGTATNGVPLDELLRGIRAATLPFYELLWTSCTRDEKLVLIQLAQEGFITAQCWDVAAPLVAKGLIVNEPFFAIFNRTFRDFLIDIERSEVIQQWERTEGRGLWVTAGRLIGSSVVAGGIFYLLTQDVSVQSLIPVVSGTGLFGTPIVRSFLARFAAKAGAPAA